MTAGQRSVIGMALLAVGVALMLVAALVAWSAVLRWLAVADTRAAMSMLRRDRVEDARRLAASAAARAPEEVAPALIALDPADAAAIDRIEMLAAGCPSAADREAALATVALARVLAGSPAGVDLDGTADGRLLAALAAVRAGRDPGRVKPIAGESPPHLAVQRAVHAALLRRAWQAGAVSEARAHAGALLLLRPASADAPLLLALVGVSSAVLPDAEAMRLLDGVKRDREAAIRAIAALLPARRPAIKAAHPAAVEGLP